MPADLVRIEDGYASGLPHDEQLYYDDLLKGISNNSRQCSF